MAGDDSLEVSAIDWLLMAERRGDSTFVPGIARSGDLEFARRSATEIVEFSPPSMATIGLFKEGAGSLVNFSSTEVLETTTLEGLSSGFDSAWFVRGEGRFRASVISAITGGSSVLVALLEIFVIEGGTPPA